MSIPDFQAIMLPFLQVLEGGEEMSTNEVVHELADHFQLSDEERTEMQPAGGAQLFRNRVHWAKLHLKNAELINNPSRGVVCLSDEGREVLADPPERIDIPFLKQFDAYRTFLNRSKTAAAEPDSNVEDVELAPPFDQLFGDMENAHSVLDTFADVLQELKCDSEVQDVRASISLQRWSGQRVRMRINYAKWAVFGYRMERGEGAYQIVLPQGDPAERLVKAPHAFAERLEDTTYVLGWISQSNFEMHRETLWASMRTSLQAVHRNFSQWASSPYTNANRSELYTIILNPEQRLGVLLSGVDSPDDITNSPETKYWLIAPGRGAELWDEWQRDGAMSIGWEDVGSLDEFGTKAEIVDALKAAYPDEGAKNVAYMLWAFLRGIKVGDVIFAKRGRSNILGWGLVTSSYQFDSNRSPHPHARQVDWKSSDEFPVPDSYQTMLPMKTLTAMGDKPEFLDAMSSVYSDIPGLEEDDDGVQRTWWLNANPSRWDPGTFPIGHEEFYTPYTSQGTMRRIQQAFRSAKTGDQILIYVTSPQRYLWGLATVTAGLQDTDQKELRFRLDTEFARRVPLEEMKAETSLAQCVPLIQPQGSLFPLTVDEFTTLKALTERVPFTERLPEYTREDALNDLFMPGETLDRVVSLLKRKRNVILQGAPGTGKTFVARRIAYLVMGVKDSTRAPMMQFHQSTCYEDFIQGYRPDGKGGFTLKDGTFYEFCRRAVLQPDQAFVFIIDEINRGNLSKVFGELMMLIEADKRDASFAVQLGYSTEEEELFYVPSNVYLLGTMNTADRSLSLVDFALRRRFAFVELAPGFDSPEFETCLVAQGVSANCVSEIRRRMNHLNDHILQDAHNLGRGFCIGHSFFVPTEHISDEAQWLDDIIEYEIVPLIEEYWVDDDKQRNAALEMVRD